MKTRLINEGITYQKRNEFSEVAACDLCGEITERNYYETFQDGIFIQAGEFCSAVCACKSADKKLTWFNNFITN